MAKDFTKVLKKETVEPTEKKEYKEPTMVEELNELLDKENQVSSLMEALHGTDPEAKLLAINHDPETMSFSFKASKEVLLDLRAYSVKEHKTQAEIIQEALIEYFKNNKEEYKKVLELRKAFNI